MTISTREGAGDYISIKQVWLRQIDRCNEILSNINLKNTDSQTAGIAAANTVDTLIANLVDYGDAPIKTEFNERVKGLEKDYNYPRALNEYNLIIEILNKYQMLNESLPPGYSNVTMASITKDEYEELIKE